MAIVEQLHFLNQGVPTWNSWRESNPKVDVDLSAADLHGADLGSVNLHGALLSQSNMNGANLTRADLGRAILHDASLIGADLRKANLRAASLWGADLRGATLWWVDLVDSRLMDANLVDADLQKADLSGANLASADFGRATIGWTTFGKVDLSKVKGLATVVHEGPSTIGIDTIYESRGRIPEAFLRGAGVPDDFIRHLATQVRKGIGFFSCFISYSNKDQRFAEKLLGDLRAKGVRCWYFAEDATWGKSVWGEINREIQTYDKLVVICSENSLQSGPVLREIERGLQREDRERGGDVVFPVRVDDFVFEMWKHERKADVTAKVVGDFRGWDTDAGKYRQQLNRMLDAIRAGT